MSVSTFLSHRKYFWLKLNVVISLILVAVYVWHRPPGGRSGGTVIGYTYGCLAAILMLYLLWYGIRKRSYLDQGIGLREVLSAHVWTGLSLVVLTALHAGFSFSWSVHTAAYLFLLATVMSGIWGAINYVTLAPKIQSHRGGPTVTALIEQIRLVSTEIEELSQGKSDQFLKLANKWDFDYTSGRLGTKKIPAIEKKAGADALGALTPAERTQGMSLLSLVQKKIDLARKVSREIEVKRRLKVWLHLHIPLSIGTLAFLIIHIFSVLYYG